MLMPEQNGDVMVDSGEFYEEYHGHNVGLLGKVVRGLRQSTRLFLVGDSSFDNKHWFFTDKPFYSKSETVRSGVGNFLAPALNGYEDILSPTIMVKDVSYWLNKECEERSIGSKVAAVNCAIEESSVGERHDGLLAQDEFVADTITDNDILLVSVGGNDIALKPNGWTIMSMVGLTYLTPTWMIKKFKTAIGIGHLRSLFKSQIEAYIHRILAKRDVKPRAVAVCMIYYPCVKGDGWASAMLNRIGYFDNPQKFQSVIKLIYEQATSNILLDGDIPVIPVPLFEALDPTDEGDYECQVEPSVVGGHKMATLIMDKLHEYF
eukprot:m.116188 g.116188  ORF g.116188 m.116188 type:complete len:320 (+) comp9302_c0_seq8:256-1215(+)